LNGKIALTTGASRGIATTLAEQGTICILVSRKKESLDQVVNTIQANGKNTVSIACYVGHIDQINVLFEEVRKKVRSTRYSYR